VFAARNVLACIKALQVKRRDHCCTSVSRSPPPSGSLRVLLSRVLLLKKGLARRAVAKE
jgi:hypothetical protein